MIRKNALNAYQTEAHDYAMYDKNIMYPFFKLAEETGEVCGTVAKVMKENPHYIPNIRCLSVQVKRDIAEELGDCLWNIAEIAGLLDFDLDTVAQMNLVKLAGRRARGTLTSAKRDE